MTRQIISHRRRPTLSGFIITLCHSLRRPQRPLANSHRPRPPPADPPRAWLESEPSAKWTDASLALALPAGASTLLRCFVAANPLAQNQILQIEWLKDGRRLLSAANQAGPAGVRQRLQIEKANHLHMGSEPSAAVPASRRQRPGRLLTSSSLTIRQASKSDAGLYNCQFKLIPTPSAGQGSAGAQQPARVSSGQAPVGLQLTVIEGECRLAPLVGLSEEFNFQSPAEQQTRSCHRNVPHFRSMNATCSLGRARQRPTG